MTIYPAHQYRDPLDVLIADESRTCKGCEAWAECLADLQKRERKQ